jgi:hypothetical protein
MKKYIFNPFTRIAGIKAFLLGIIVVILTALICFFSHAHFDGVLDAHFSGNGNMFQYFKEGFIDLASVIIVFYILGLIVAGTRFRFIDMAGTMAFARIPVIFTPIFALVFSPEKFTHYMLYTFLHKGEPVTISTLDIFSFIITTLITILMVIWMIALMWNAFRICMNSNKPKIVVTFIIGIILAEVISKITLIYF